MTRHTSDFIGKIAAFLPDPSVVVGCVPRPDACHFHGSVTEAIPAPPFGPSAIPDWSLTVRGRSGKTMTISLVANYTTLHPTWAEALSIK